ncbi:hypothetical protein [Sphingomonas sp. G-3-2-10]|uniref:hypothetical protein n=1 Tax=Sphingomonas sp. G-3-2-10 TaxID=2728838 RepID=UPI00146F34D7|nr:hypothetical protein [Sphingomonas sp. G-3-2-10]NML07756.1 hypothetical protein [Sphingomonas sp. G-3-2-10]
MSLPETVRAAIPAARAASREAVARWRGSDAWRAAADAFTGDGDAVAGAEALLRDSGWCAALLAPLVEALAADPLFEPPFRLSRDAVRTGAILFECPAVSISASVFDAAALAAMPVPATVVFPGRVTVTRYHKAGGATLRRWEVDPLEPGFRAVEAAPCRSVGAIRLCDSEVLRVDGRVRAQRIGDAASDIVQLTATMREGDPLIREYRASDGAFVRAVSADEGASRTEMLLTFLRVSGRADASEQFDAATRDPAFHLRWAAMREWLALDARAALPRLAEMARNDPDGEVRDAAARTLEPVREKVAVCLA